MNYVVIINNVATEVLRVDPINIWPWRVNEFTPYEGDVEVGYVLVNGVFVPPPLQTSDFRALFNQRLQQEIETYKVSKFDAVLALSPNYPDLPETLEEFIANLDLVDWTWVTEAYLGERE